MLKNMIRRWRERRAIKKTIAHVLAQYPMKDPGWDDRCACGVAYWERWEGKTCDCTNSG
ncbi:MAG: hypothetical protein IID41_14435 [Planctomycetes bacterium]|nr:hypothetical protein [Planctomycetota bacterium]